MFLATISGWIVDPPSAKACYHKPVGRQVYDYKTFQMWSAIGLLFTGFFLGLYKAMPNALGLLSGNFGGGTMLSVWIGFLSLLVFCFGCGTLCHVLQERIVIENGQLTYTNWLGRQVKCPVSGVMAVVAVNDRADDNPLRERGAQTYRVLTTGGAFRFYPTIRDFSKLVEVLNIGAEQHTPSQVCEVSPPEV